MRKRCPNGSRKKNGICVKYTRCSHVVDERVIPKRCPNGSRKINGVCVKKIPVTPYAPPETSPVRSAYMSPETSPVSSAYISPSVYMSPEERSAYTSPENRSVYTSPENRNVYTSENYIPVRIKHIPLSKYISVPKYAPVNKYTTKNPKPYVYRKKTRTNFSKY